MTQPFEPAPDEELAALHRDVQVAYAKREVVLPATAKGQQPLHFPQALGEQGGLAVVMLHAAAPQRKANGQRHAQRIGIFHRHRALHTGHVFG